MNLFEEVSAEETQWAKVTDRMLNELDPSFQPVRCSTPEDVNELRESFPEHWYPALVRCWDVPDQSAEVILWMIPQN